MEYMKDVYQALDYLKLKVEECKEDILTDKDIVEEANERFKILSSLVELEKEYSDSSENYITQKDIYDMWKSLYKHEKKIENVSNCNWVVRFVDDIIQAKRLPQYLTLNNSNAKKLLGRLINVSDELKALYKNNCIDDRVFINTNGPSPISLEGEVCDVKDFPRISIIEALNSCSDDLMFEIKCFLESPSEKEDGSAEARLFLWKLSVRNNKRYQQDLYNSLRVVTWCVYNRYYSNSMISTMFKRLREK